MRRDRDLTSAPKFCLRRFAPLHTNNSAAHLFPADREDEIVEMIAVLSKEVNSKVYKIHSRKAAGV